MARHHWRAAPVSTARLQEEPRTSRTLRRSTTLRVVPALTAAEARTARADRAALMQYARCVIELHANGRITIHENSNPLLHVHAIYVRGMLAVEIANRWMSPYVRQSVKLPSGKQYVIRARRAMTELTSWEAERILPVLLERMQAVTDYAVTHGTLGRTINGVYRPPRGWKDTVIYVQGGRARTGRSGRDPHRVAATVAIERGIAWKVPAHARALTQLLRTFWEVPDTTCRFGAKRVAIDWVASRITAILAYKREEKRRAVLRTFFATEPNSQWLHTHALLAVLDRLGKQHAQFLLNELAAPARPNSHWAVLSQDDAADLWSLYCSNERIARPLAGYRLRPYPGATPKPGIHTLMLLPSQRFQNHACAPTREPGADDEDHDILAIPFTPELAAEYADVPF